jgi:hypothetical protein
MRRSFAIAAVVICSISALCQSTSAADLQTLKAVLEEIRLLRQDLQTTTVASQRVQIVLYRLQLQDAAVSRATKLVEEGHSKLSELATDRSRVSAEMQRADQQKDTTQDMRERKLIEDQVLPQLKQHLERISKDEEQWQASSNDAEGQLKIEQTKLDVLHNLLDELDRALENVGRSSTGIRRSESAH